MTKELKSVIETLMEAIPDASCGLPDEVFYFVSRITPLVNADLLIKDELNRTLLAWRDDQYSGKGWHVPGGIVRFKETLEARIEKVAVNEIGTTVRFEATPISVNQMIHSTRDNRGHFVSFLYRCYLPASFQPDNRDLERYSSGYLLWHDSCPEDILPIHRVYKTFIEEPSGEKKSDIFDDVRISAVLP